jgi:hypothetical protein
MWNLSALIFLGQSQFYGVSRALSQYPTEYALGHHVFQVFPGYKKNATFLTMCIHIVTFP